jgi:hypothetical protein
LVTLWGLTSSVVLWVGSDYHPYQLLFLYP